MNVSSTNFGTKLNIGASKEGLLSVQSQNFLNGLIIAEDKMSKNRIKDDLILSINRLPNDPKSDTLTLSYRSTTGKFGQNDIVTKIKDLPRRTKKIEQFFLNSLRKLQSSETRVKTVYLTTSKKQDEQVINQSKANYLLNKTGFDDFTCA